MTQKGKRGRPPSDNPMVHTAVVLPRDLLNRLKADADGAGASAEIRHRLVAYDADDGETRNLIECIKALAKEVASDLGRNWYESEYAKAAFAAGIIGLMGQVSGAVRDIPGHTDNPETIGRTHARRILAKRRSKESE